jgi:hypothetical protein
LISFRNIHKRCQFTAPLFAISNCEAKRKSVVNFTNILSAHLGQFPCSKKSVNYTSSTKKLCAKLSYEKAACKMLVKLTPGKNSFAKKGLRSSSTPET